MNFSLRDSDLAGRTLRAAELPAGSLVTSIPRNGEVLTPSDDVVPVTDSRFWDSTTPTLVRPMRSEHSISE